MLEYLFNKCDEIFTNISKFCNQMSSSICNIIIITTNYLLNKQQPSNNTISDIKSDDEIEKYNMYNTDKL